MKLRTTAFAILGGMLWLAGVLTGDTRIVMREGSTIEFGGQEMPGEGGEVTYWIGEDRAARVDDIGFSTIVRLDRGESYEINRSNRTYTVSGVSTTGSDGGFGDSWKIVESDETRQVGSWTAKRHDMTRDMGDDGLMEVTLWMADIGVDLDAIHAFAGAFSQFQLAVDWVRVYQHLDGFPVRKEERAQGLGRWLELQSVSEETPPPGIYEVPEGFKAFELPEGLRKNE